ncbi:Scr1 family TA system antitoxin-like transcriptional regulator [Embleya scabrispora]|uniref:Scr1 family TA system antitoxin-like transcriptional regulator n=1 Tax=Embleya scabrispora TaxID=159449 RepID=UPI0022856E7F|nr:Scr1 family TA system antitoxin-like transcriptional regulator [Embleya scabrispora]
MPDVSCQCPQAHGACRAVGGLATLAEQLEHLLDLAARFESVRIQVLPSSSPVASSIPLYLLESSPGKMVAWIDMRSGSALVTGPDDTAELRVLFERLEGAALDPAASLELIDRKRREACTAIETSL